MRTDCANQNNWCVTGLKSKSGLSAFDPDFGNNVFAGMCFAGLGLLNLDGDLFGFFLLGLGDVDFENAVLE